uniref:Coiled-coil domain-containing protein 15 n=1 Tax=Leptobrachium leishanense TaxID=445787 RepID=A0A8C5PDS8_9ANUR
MAPPGSRILVNQAVLAERNPGNIAPVAAWVKCEQDWGESPAGVSALKVEERHLQIQREKEEKLRRFQSEVRRRVNQNAKLRKNHQIQKSRDAVAREGSVVKQSSDATGHRTPKRNTCVYRRTPVAICSPRSRWVSAKKIHDNLNEEEEQLNKLFKDRTKTLCRTMTQVRHRLAALQTVEKEELTLPGGVWKVSPTRDNPVSRRYPVPAVHEDHREDLLLAGYHDLPVEMLAQHPGDLCPGKQPLNPVCSRLIKELYPAGPAPAFGTDYRASLVLRPGINEEEERKERQNQYIMYRRLFMDIEREQVKETKRRKEHHKKMLTIKREKESQRQLQEQRLREEADLEELDSFRRECDRLALERDVEKENQEKTQKNREYVRYIEALRAQMKEKMKLHSIELPALCCCGSGFWDSHPDTCANNCIFYKNPKAYTRALQSVILSRDTWDGGISSRFSACNLGT